MPAVGSYDKSGADFDCTAGSFCRDSDDASVFHDQVSRFRLHLDLKSRIAFALFDDEVQKVPLRHQRQKLAVSWKVSKIGDLHRLFADLSSQGTHLLMRPLQEFLKNSEFTHQLQGGGMNCVPTEIPQKIGMLLEHDDFNSR